MSARPLWKIPRPPPFTTARDWFGERRERDPRKILRRIGATQKCDPERRECRGIGRACDASYGSPELLPRYASARCAKLP